MVHSKIRILESMKCFEFPEFYHICIFYKIEITKKKKSSKKFSINLVRSEYFLIVSEKVLEVPDISLKTTLNGNYKRIKSDFRF